MMLLRGPSWWIIGLIALLTLLSFVTDVKGDGRVEGPGGEVVPVLGPGGQLAPTPPATGQGLQP